MRIVLACVVVGALLAAAPAVAGEEKKEAEAPIENRCFRVKYSTPEKVFSFLDSLKSPRGNIVVSEEDGTVLIMDTAESIAEMEKVLAVLERKRELGVFRLKAMAKDVEQVVNAWLRDNKLGRVIADEHSNQLFVECLPGRMGEVETIVNQLGGRKVEPGKPAEGEVKDTSRVRLDIRLVLAEEGQKERVLNHSLLTANYQESKWTFGKKLSFVTTTTSQTQKSTVVAKDVNFVDVGGIVRMAPFAAYDGSVSIQIKPEFSKHTSTTKEGVPVVEVVELEATVVVQKGDDFVRVFSGEYFEPKQSMELYVRAAFDEKAEVRTK